MTRRLRRSAAFGATVAMLAGAATLIGQRQFFGGYEREPAISNPAYDGRFTFARLKYVSGPGGYYYRGLPAWAHGYVPGGGGNEAELSLMKIMNELSYLNPHADKGVVLTLDDPELFKYPVAYMTEAGFWTMNDKEEAAFRSYLLKGGFVIFDDFRSDSRGGGGWANFEANMRRLIPNGRFIDMQATHAIFHSFFEIDSLDIIPQAYNAGRPYFRGVFEDNDRRKPLQMIINYNTDISQFWEWSSVGLRSIEQTNEAYKLGVNYIIYGMTH